MSALSVFSEPPFLQSIHDLQSGARRHLLGGLVLGSQGWGLAFLVVASLAPLLRVPPPVVCPGPALPHVLERIPMLPDIDFPKVELARPRTKEPAIPVPAPDKVAPAVETVPPSSDGVNSQQSKNGGGPVGPTRETGVTVLTPPPPGTYIRRDEEPAFVTVVKPEYPEMARDLGIEGTVLLWVWVETTGRVGDVRVIRSVPLFDEAATRAARRWVFTPALSGGHPVAVWVAVPVKFTVH